MKAVLSLVDLEDNLLAIAKRFGATAAIDSFDGNAAAAVMALTKCRDADAAMLMQTMQSKKIDPKQLSTHGFALDQMIDAYDSFARAVDTKALKVTALKQLAHA